jgi:hypothetical protein
VSSEWIKGCTTLKILHLPFNPDGSSPFADALLARTDAPWLSKAQNRRDVRFVHPKISSGVGDKIGVRSLRRMLMESHADTIDFGLPTEAFGQTESLTRRLRHILGEAPMGYCIRGHGKDIEAVLVATACPDVSQTLEKIWGPAHTCMHRARILFVILINSIWRKLGRQS